MPEKFYLTTPIYYVNARPHIGHAYTTIVADVLARRSRAQGNETWFLTGTDEHGQKIERSAAAAGIPPQQFTDEVSATFQNLWKRMGITNDQFIRTTSEAHKRGVQKLFSTLYERDKIYLSSYTGQYSIGEEMFVDGPPGTIGPDGKPTETVTEENFFFRLSDYQLPLLDLIESDTLRITPEARKNEVLNFLRGPVVAFERGEEIYNQRYLPPTPHQVSILEQVELSRVEVLSYSAQKNPYVAGALNDLSVSRSSFAWGIPVPEPAASKAKEKHVIYVWLDALANYITALGYGSDDESNFQKFWPADLHLVGKEIIRFHCVYWPAFLMAAGLPLPEAVTAHGWLLFDDSKMSKSKGNIVRTEAILDFFGTLCPPPAGRSLPGTLGKAERPNEAQPPSQVATTHSVERIDRKGTPSGVPQRTHENEPSPHDRDLFAADVLRYFLLREIPFGQDGGFSSDALFTRYNADLANGYGNLVSRTLTMIEKNCDGEVPFTENIELIFSEFNPGYFPRQLTQWFEQFELSSYLRGVWTLISIVDGFITEEKPWKLAKHTDEPSVSKLASVLYTAAESIRIITALLHPILPYATAKVWAQLGLGDIEQAARNGQLRDLAWGGLKPGTKLGPLSPIFPRADKGLAQIMSQMEQEKTLTTVTSQSDTAIPAASDLPEAPIASNPPVSKFVDEKFNASPETPLDPTHPAAPPRAFGEASAVAGSNAHTTERSGTPPHQEATPSGIFSAATPPTAGSADASPQITIDDFAKIELRVAQILVCERIPKADKLLRLEVDLGHERRQILSGIAEWYTPEELVGRRIVVITNLAPRKMRGLESHGMLLAASTEGGKPHLATFDSAAGLPLGSRLK